MRYLWTTLLLLLAMSDRPAQAEESRIVTLRSDLWCPYNCQPHATNEGVLVDLARAAFEKAGYKVDYQLLNWARAVDQTRYGDYDGVIGALRTDAPDFIFPEEVPAASRNCFYTRPQDTWVPGSDLETGLHTRRLGVANAYSYGPQLDRYIEHHRDDGRVSVLSGDDLFQRNLEKLRAERIDTLVEDHWVAAWNMQQGGASPEAVRQAGCLPTVSVYIAFSPAHPERAHELAALLDKTVKQMRRNGELDHLLARYGVH